MSTTLAITSLALSSAALANTPTCGTSAPLPVEAIYAIKASVALLLVAPVIGLIVDNEYDRVFSALTALVKAFALVTTLWLVAGALVVLFTPVGSL